MASTSRVSNLRSPPHLPKPRDHATRVSPRCSTALKQRSRAIWKLADRSLMAHHYRPEHLLTVIDTDTMMRRDTILTDRELAAATEQSAA